MPPMTDRGGRDWRGWYFAVVAAIATAIVLVGIKEEAVAFDFATVYVPAAERIQEGDTPFPSSDDPVWQGHQAYVYPPLTALLALPYTALESPALEYAGVVTAMAILLLAPWLVGVRDPRCYAVFALWPPTMTTWQNANVSALLVLTCALAWRFRDSWPKEGVALGIGIGLKLLLWPLGFWLLATRRLGALVAAAVASVLAIVGSWAAIGFKGFLEYPDLLRMITDIESENGHSISVYSAGLAVGAPSAVAHVLSAAVALAFAAGAIVCGRRDDDRASFLLALLAALAFAPIAWLHYLTMLVVPIAIFRPRLSGLWLTPLLFWVIAIPGWPVEPRRLVAAVVVTILIARLVLWRGSGTVASARREPVAEGAS